MGRGPRVGLREGDFWALRDVSFSVSPGEALGIIGPNGAGKSTMLKILSRIMRPTRGSISIGGRVGALIELAAGFHGDLTGGENVYLQGAIMGMRRREIAAKFDRIIEFAGLAEFVGMPVKRYSSGMNARLGFSIAAHLDVDVLLIDEVLSVGDFAFQQRAFGRLRELATSGIPVVVVSHQLERVSDLCSHGVLLKQGRIEARGSPAECIEAYVASRGGGDEDVDTSRPIEITAVEVEPERVASGDRVEMVIHVTNRNALLPDTVEVWFQARSLQTGQIVFGNGPSTRKLDVPRRGDFRVRASMQMNVPPGTYAMECHLWDRLAVKELHYGPTRLVRVQGGPPFHGSVQMNSTTEVLPPITAPQV